MKRSEWYNSSKFLKLRLLGHISGDIKQKTQELYDLLNILNIEYGPMTVYDKFCLAERQLRIIDGEAANLGRAMDALIRFLEPAKLEPDDVP